MRVLSCTVVLMMVFGMCMSQCSQCNRFSKGCSLNNRISNYKGWFTPACELHDLCYSCGSKFGIGRAKCDGVFNDNMKTACGSTILCKLARYANIAWVRSTGWASYHRTPKAFCSEEWVRSCLP